MMIVKSIEMRFTTTLSCNNFITDIIGEGFAQEEYDNVATAMTDEKVNLVFLSEHIHFQCYCFDNIMI